MDTKINSRFHPLANVFPLIGGEEFAELVEDVRANGLFSPVVMFEGKILDGRNRYLACQQLGIPHTEKQFTGEDAAAYVWSANAVRRQLTASQKALAAAKISDAKVGYNQDGQPTGTGARVRVPVTTIGDAARMAGVGRRTVEEAKRVLTSAVDEVVAAVEEGELSVHTAERVSQLPADEQTRIMATTPAREIHKVVPGNRSPRKESRPVVHTTETPEDEEPQGVGRGNVGPKVALTRMLEKSSSEGAKLRARNWAENMDVIPELDTDLVAAFVKDLRAENRANTQLIKLIELSLKKNLES
jgi:ParB-like chromosome segregation protein Spo0J